MIVVWLWCRSYTQSALGHHNGPKQLSRTSTYTFKRAFFRHERRTAPKFSTHVRIETRMALPKKNGPPTLGGFRGLSIVWRLYLWDDVCLWVDDGFWDVCGFIRPNRRTAPKFGTHVRIDTLTLNLFYLPHPRGFRGYLLLKIFPDRPRPNLARM